MPDVVEDLEPQEDASVVPEDRFANDLSIDTGVIEVAAEPESVETETEDDEAEPGNEAESSPAEVEVLDEKAGPKLTPEQYSAEVKERIDKLTEIRRETERALTIVQQENEALKKQLGEIQVPVEPFKTLADFDYEQGKYDSYLAAEIDQRATTAAEKVASRFQSQTQLKAQEAQFRQREKDFAASTKDYYDKVYGERDGQRYWEASSTMVAEIQASDTGHETAYYLANHPETASEIAKLPESRQIARMAVLEHTLKTEKAAAKPTKVTKAPPPPPKLPAGDGKLDKDVADMTDAEFAKWRGKQIANR